MAESESKGTAAAGAGGAGAGTGAGGSSAQRAVGIVGYGNIGKYLANAILTDAQVGEQLSLAWVWNRSADKLAELDAKYRLEDLDSFADHPRRADIIIEVAHPSITCSHGPRFCRVAHFVSGSPTAFADAEVEGSIRAAAAEKNGFGVYVPAGAMWGAQDIKKMADLDTLGGLTVSMRKHPRSLKVLGKLKEVNDALKAKFEAEGPCTEETVLYAGPVRQLCPLAPNNVNTMAAAALAAHSLGFDKVQAKLIADSRVSAHIIDIEVTGKPRPSGEVFRVTTQRYNPAAVGKVTGSATYASFLSSLLNAGRNGDGLHLC